MNPDATEPSAPQTAPASAPRQGSRVRFALSVLALSGIGAISVIAGHALARSAVVDLGPTDDGYVLGFRDIERDGDIYFRWSSVPSSSLQLQIRFCGPGSVRLRVRRHFMDPAFLSVSLAGTLIGQRSVQAREDSPYEVIEFPVSKVVCESDALVILESHVDNPRPLGVAIDWMEFRSNRGFKAAPASVIRGAVAVGVTAVALLIAGGSLPMVATTGGGLALLIGISLARDPVAGERMLRGGLPALLMTLMIGAAIRGLSGALRLSTRGRVALVTLTVGVVVSRSIFLNPQAFYPDYRVHALVLQTLESSGLQDFLDRIFEIQYARSLGLQQIHGNWYPFPYPPGSYVLAEGVSRVFGLGTLDASLAMGIAACSLIPLVTVALGTLLGLGETASLAGAFFVAFQPLLVRRMALGYFPGLAGQIADAVSLLLLVRLAKGPGPPGRRMLWLGVALLGAFLVYTQSIANFGLLSAGLLAAELFWRRPTGLATAGRISLVAALALVAALGTFYWRYLPVLDNVSRQIPQPESSVLDRLDTLRRANPAVHGVDDEEASDDPFTGPTLEPARGLARLGARLWRFNGPYAIAILVGCWTFWRRSDRGSRNLVLAWGSVCVWISLLASGLPGPNGFQHLKDLEFVSPLLALMLGVLFERLWHYRPTIAVAFATGWLAFAGRAFVSEVAERLMVLTGR